MMRKIIILTITLVFSSFHLFAGNVFDNVSDSNNWKDEHPALLAIDEHNNSFAQLQTGQESGWMELLLEESSQIMGYRIDALIPEGSWLSVAYDDEGVRKRIPTSNISSNDGVKTIFFQSEHIVSDSVSLYLDGAEAAEVKIYDFELILSDINNISLNAKLTLSEHADNILDYFDSNFLIDGLVGTTWWAFKSFRGGRSGPGVGGPPVQFSFEQDNLKYNKERILNGRNAHYPQVRSFAEFDVEVPGKYDRFSYYVDEFAWGTLNIKVLTDEGYLEIGSTDMMESKGWNHISLDALGSDISRIRIELSGFHTVMGGLGEIELRRLEKADCYKWYQLTGFNDEAGAAYSLFEIENEEVKDHEMVVAIDSNEYIADLPVTVNGRKLFNYSHEVIGTINIFRIKLDSNILWKGNNFISIETEENSRVLGSVIREVTVDSEVTITGLLTGYDKVIELPNSYDVHQLIVVSENDSAFDVSLSGEDGDIYLEPSEVSGKTAKYTMDSPLETERIKIYGGDGQYSVSLKGNSTGTGTFIRISPEKESTHGRGGQFLHGISDALYSDTIKINGKRANKLGNYFWVPISRLGITTGGIYDLEVIIERGGLQINSYKIEYLYEIDSNQLQIDQSEDIVYTTDDFYLLTGKVTGRGKSLYINDQEISLNGRNFEHMEPLNDGLNIIRIELKNLPGNHIIALKFLYVYKYADNLIINIDRPSDGSYVSSNPVIVSGKIQNAVDLESVTVNGVEAKLDGSSFSASIDIESEIATILVNVTDSIVGTKSKSITIFQDLTPPQVSDVFPPDNYWIASHVIPVTGYVTDETRTQVYINGYLASQIDTYFRSVTSLVEGSNFIYITARDLAGNETHPEPFTVNADTTAPFNLEVQTDVDGWTNNNRPVLTFSAEDSGIGISHYEVSIDGRSFQEQGSPFQAPVIEDGIREIVVKAVDLLGNFSVKAIEVNIDTLPPDTPSTFRAIPGNENAVLSWNEDDDETVSYKITSLNGLEEVVVEVDRDSGLLDEETNISSFEIDYQEESFFSEVELVNGDVYRFSLIAIDRAGNESISKEVEVTIGISIVEYDKDEGSFVEFDSVKLIIGPNSLPEEIEQIVISETMSEDMEELSTYPMVSPIYSFNAISFNDEIIDHVDFEEDFYCKLDYNEEDLPEGFPEQNLGVYFFDTTWSRWFKEPNSIVDTENNQIIFSTNHFTEFTIQPTVIEDLSPQELAAIEFEPFSSTTQHQQLTVSQQSGGISTSMTEFVLPGKNGFDLELRRIYDTGTAKGDANGLSANISVMLGDIFSGEVAVTLGTSFGATVASQILDSVKTYFQNNGDFAYSTGQGWRLNLPYIRGANSSVLVRTSSGSFHDIKSMEVNKDRTKDYVLYRELWLENHEGEDFTLMVKQTKDPIQMLTTIKDGDNEGDIDIGSYVSSVLDSWTLMEAVLYEKDGKEYRFDPLGRLSYIRDPNGNEITLEYDGLLLDYIEDTFGRRVKFEYAEITDYFSVPQINKIWIENDPDQREVSYEYEVGSIGINLPLLSKAIDVGKREYNYDYDPNFLFSGEFGIKINVVALIGDLFSGGAFSTVASKFGLSSVTIHAAAQAFWTFPMSFAEGYVIGKNDIDYDIKTLDYWEADTADYLFGFIPTALDISIGMQQRFLTNNLIRTNLFLGESVTESYTYDFEYAGEKQFYCARSTKDDGRLKEEYLYDTKRKVRWSWATISDYIGDIINGGLGVTSRPFNFEFIPLEKTKNSYDSITGEFLESVQTEWYKSNLQPSLKQVYRGGGTYFRNTYQYDNWGNITRQGISDVNGTRTSSKTVFSVYADTNSSRTDSEPWHTSPFPAANINGDYRIHDRLVQQLVKMEDSVSDIRYIDTAYDYDTKGNRTASALYNEEYGWQQTDYIVNSSGEVIKKTSPLGHVTDITYDYDSAPGYYTISQQQNQVAQGDGSTQNINQSTIYYRYTGLPSWSVDGRGMVSHFEYDEVGRKTLVELPDDDDSPAWDPISEVDPGFRGNNPSTEISYNDDDQTITVVNAGGAETKYSYHDYGKITEKIQTNRYGSSGIPGSGISFNSEEEVRTLFNYNIYNNIISVEDPNGNITDYEYDALGNLTREILPAVDGTRAERTYSYTYMSREKRITNENGYQTTEYSDSKGNVLRRIELDKNGSFDRSADFYFDADSNPVREIDGNYNVTNYRYNERNQMVETTLPSALLYDGVSEYTSSPRVVTTYNKDGFKITETSYKNGDESVVRFSVNGLGQTIETTAYFSDLQGNNKQSVTKSIFDKSGNEVVVIDPRNYTINRTFNARGKVLTETDALGNTVSYEYDKLDHQIAMIDQRGNSGNYPGGDFEIEYIYDDLDRMIHGLLPKHSSLSNNPEVKLVYDFKGNLLYRIEADAGLTAYEYDRRNRVTTETRTAEDSAISYTTLTDYDAVGNVIKLTQPGASPVEFEYDALNRKILDIYPDGGTRYYRYDENDNLVYEDGANGYRTYYNYNALNLLTKKTDPEDGVSEYMYDEAGSLTLHKDENGVERRSVYDEINRLIKETDGRSGVSTFTYDLSGNLTQKRDPNGTDVTYIYGPTNLMNSAYYLNGVESNTVSYNYDEGGVVKSVTDGSVTNRYNIPAGEYIPDPYGLIFSDEQTSGAGTRTVTYDYDIKNRLTNMIMPSGESVTYNHNGLDQITSMSDYISGNIEYADNSYLSGYTLVNNVTLSREYDDKLRLTRLDYNNGIEELKKFTFSYDREDNIIQKNSDYFSYDGKNQLKSASLSGEESAQEYPYEGEGKIMDIHPDVLGEETMVLTQDDLTLDWGAKSLGIDLGFGYRVKRIILKPNSTTTRVTEQTLQVFASLYNLEDYYTEPVSFTYEKDDTTGIITILFENLQFARFIKIHSHFYEMDETGESLYNESTMTLNETDPFDVFILSSGRNEFYTYDPKGNRERLSYFTTSFTSYDYSYYPGSDLIKTDGKYGYRYDANGNMLEKGTVYTELGDELTITKEDEYFRYEYDLLNRLKTVYSLDEATGSEVFVKSYEYNAAGMRITAEDSEGIKTQYTFDTGGKVVEKETDGFIRNFFYLGSKVVAHKEAGETLYYGTDHLGSSVLMTDSTGAAVWTGAVTPFADSETTEGLSEHVMFTGKELDTDTGLYYYNARWYDPNLGRFITEDPARDGLNWFIYANNSPLRFIDPTGLESADAAYSRNKILKRDNPIVYHNEQIIRLLSERIHISSQLVQTNQKIKQLYEEIDEARFEYYGAVLNRGWNILTFWYAKENSDPGGMAGSIDPDAMEKELDSAMSGDVGEDNILYETVGVEIDNMSEISSLKEEKQVKEEDLERVNSELDSQKETLNKYASQQTGVDNE